MGKILRAFVCAALALPTACGEDSTREDNVGELQQALSINDRILGFESVSNDWGTPEPEAVSVGTPIDPPPPPK